MKDSDDSIPLAVMIAPNVWVGDCKAASNEECFNQYAIKSVVNLTPRFPNVFGAMDIDYLRIPVHDQKGKRDNDLFLAYIPSILEFINKTVNIEDSAILVHCIKGRQRSCAAVAAYLIKYCNMTPVDAMYHIVRLKKDAFHWGKSVNFLDVINRFNRQLRNSS